MIANLRGKNIFGRRSRAASILIAALAAAAISCRPSGSSGPAADSGEGDTLPREAMFYQGLKAGAVRCELCPRRCVIPEGGRGFCRVRENREGKLYSLVFGRPCTVDVGPIEKAPLYHFIPGHRRLCLATVSCNLRCRHCHNWQISQAGPGERRELELSPEEIVERALSRELTSISFTYTEPVIFYEYVYEISKRAQKRGIRTSIVSNGYINPGPLRRLLPHLDAVKIDLKGFTDKCYREVAAAELGPVLETLKVLKEEGAFFEIVNLVIPTLNDDPADLRRMCEWIAENLGADVPMHFSRFSPSYRLTHLPPTPVRTLEEAVRIAKESGLKYVYIGNVPGHRYNSTFCPGCEKRLIHRVHFSVLENNVKDGACGFCGYEIAGVWR